MTQADSQIGSGDSGTAYRTADNAGKKAILNHHKGNSAPTYAEAGIIWINDSSTPWLLRVYDGTDWITIGEINATNNTFQPYNGTATGRIIQYAADSGSANAYAVTPAPAVTAYATGQIVTLKPANANTGASTLNVNALGTKNIKLLDNTDPPANSMLTTGVYFLFYDGTSQILLNPSLVPFTGDSGSGGIKGLVPAPGAGDAAANKVLGAGGAWVANGSLNVTLNAQSAGYTVLAADKACIVSLTGSSPATFAFTAAATLGSGWFCYLYNNSTAALTLDPNGSEQIDALTSYIMYPGEVRLVQCSGTAFTTILLNGGTATFNSSGSWTRPPGYTTFEIELISSGQSGASRATTGNAAGGCGGSLVEVTVPASSLVAAGSAETVTIGGTCAGVSGNTNGNNMNASSITINGTAFGTPAAGGVAFTAAASNSAAGGNGFNSNGAATYGGTSIGAETGGLNFAYTVGADVTASNVPEQSTGYQMNGMKCPGAGGACSSTAGGIRTGGISVFGGPGGAGGANTGGNGTNGTAPGGGGGGAVQGGTSGSGAPGRVTVRGII